MLLLFPEPRQLSRRNLGNHNSLTTDILVSEAGVVQGAKSRHALSFVNAYG